MSKFFTTATLVAAVQALAFDGKPARATDGVVPDATFHLPEITQAPEVDVRALLRRDTGDNTVLIGPDNTCGYVSGRPGAPITCRNDYTCAFIIQEDFGRAGCCEGNDCGLRATCLDVRQVSRSCDNGCLQDTFTLKCTASSAPYCNTVTFFSGVIDYYCGANNISTPQQLYTTYNGQTDAKPWQQVIVTPTASGGTGVNSASEDGSFFISFTSARPSNTGSPSGSGSGNNGSGGNSGDNNNSGSGSGSGSSSNTDQPAQKQESTPVGPIVGGVVGGVGGIALIGLAIFLFIRHRNKKNAANPQQPMQQTAAPGGPVPPPAGAPGYPPQTYAVPPGQPPYQQQTPPPQTYYVTSEQKPGGFVGVAPTGVPDRHDSTSPVSQFSDPRFSTQPQSPTTTLNSNWGPQPTPPVVQPGQPMPPSPNVPTTVYEAGGNVVGDRDYNSNHRGQFHEMA